MTHRSSPRAAPRRSFLASAAALTLSAAAAPARAQAWPAGKPIRLVLPSGAGGGADIFARILSDWMGKELGAQIVVDNKPGANGIVAHEQVLRQPPDGYTLLVSYTAAMVGNKLTQSKMSHDPITDFTLIGKIGGEGGNVLVVNPELPVKNVKDLVELSKSRADLSYASWGLGSGGHLVMEGVKNLTGMRINHVPYKTVAQISPDVISGVVPVGWIDSASPVPHIRSGRLRMIASSGTVRLPQTPDVPTLVEQGVQLTSLPYYTLLGPKGMPDEIVQRLVTLLNRWFTLPETAAFYRDKQNQPVPAATSPAALARQLQDDLVTWGRLITLAGVPTT